MVYDFYNKFKENPAYNKLEGNDFLIMEFKCPIETEKFQLLTESNFLMYIISGRKDLISADKTFSVKEGQALFIRKGVYTTRQYLEVEHCVLLFFMTDDFIRNFMLENNFARNGTSSSLLNAQVFDVDVNDTLKSMFHSIFGYLKMRTDIPRNLVELKFKELLFSIVLNPSNTSLTQFFSLLNQTNSKADLDYVMMKNFQHDLELEEFAKLSGRSLSTFKRDFQSYYHQTPGKWLNDKRLQYASTLLLSSDLNVNEVCYECGFKNAAHFNKVFKEKYQLPPRQFRVSHKNMDASQAYVAH